METRRETAESCDAFALWDGPFWCCGSARHRRETRPSFREGCTTFRSGYKEDSIQCEARGLESFDLNITTNRGEG